MTNDAKIVERFLKENEAGGYNMLPKEVHDAMNNMIMHEVEVHSLYTKFRVLKGHLESIELYKEKEYTEGFVTCLDNAFDVINSVIKNIGE